MHLVCVYSIKLDVSYKDVFVMCIKDEDQDICSIPFTRYKVKDYICVQMAIT